MIPLEPVTPENDRYPFRIDEFEDNPGDECGRWSNGRLTRSCALAGTEFCDFECPFRDSLDGRLP